MKWMPDGAMTTVYPRGAILNRHAFAASETFRRLGSAVIVPDGLERLYPDPDAR
jgi:hypothetical protein